jgi:hypothetical protein
MSILWTLPANVLSPAARPAGIAVMSTAGIFGSLVTPSIIGFLRDQSGGFASGLLYLVGLLAVAMASTRLAVFAQTSGGVAHRLRA